MQQAPVFANKTANMPKYYFQLGNTPQLSLLELQAVLKGTSVQQVSEYLATAELNSENQAEEIIDLLGGTIKVIKHLDTLTSNNHEHLIEKIISNLIVVADNKKIQFAISELGRDHLEPIDGFEIKNQLKLKKIPSRYVDGSRHGLSAAILKNKKSVIELYLLTTQDGIQLGQTIAVQDIDDWTHKDRNKPYFDKKKGMLPPKVALMMVNIAIGDNPIQPDRKNLLLDPFCGTGTILIEGLLTDLDVIGSDQDPESIAGTRRNLEWLAEYYPFTHEYQLIQADATRIPKLKDKVQYIVTEPFLGKPRPNPAKLPYIFKGLEKLYLGAFKNWTSVLAEGASIVIVFPTVTIKDKYDKETQYSLESLIDKLATFGYTTLSKPVLYHRPHAIVQRQIYRFTYKSINKE